VAREQGNQRNKGADADIQSNMCKDCPGLLDSQSNLVSVLLDNTIEFAVIIDSDGRIEAANEIASASLRLNSESDHQISLYDCLPHGEGQVLGGKVMLACKNCRSLWFNQSGKEGKGDLVSYVCPICSENSSVQRLLIIRKEMPATVTADAVQNTIGWRKQWIDTSVKNAAMKLCEPITAIMLIVQAMQKTSTEALPEGLASQIEALQGEAQNLEVLRTRLTEFSLAEPTGAGTCLSAQADMLFWFYREKYWTRQVEITLTGLDTLPKVNLSEDAAKELFTLVADYASILGDYAIPLRLTISGTSHGVFVKLLCIYEIDDEQKKLLGSNVGDIEVSHVTRFREIIHAIRSILLGYDGMVRVIDSDAKRQGMILMIHCCQEELS